MLEENISGARLLQAGLCEDPRFRSDYLSHGVCMKAVGRRWEACYRHYQYLLTLELRVTSEEANLDAICCLRQRFLDCVDEAAGNTCDLNDALFLKKVSATLSHTEHRRLACQRRYTCGGTSVSGLKFGTLAWIVWLILTEIWIQI
ncbi:uncharacterized protein LOC108664814 [Hyalella azteca]|uniref:Uncharacterized protein LOC108664814 n=1 Tax=Hyalella azteca TaxID=294128 RepID=A0A8B7N0G4_HYAAZ|nr:uncharacterized protein LOC108664814 [Hyalella azteca]